MLFANSHCLKSLQFMNTIFSRIEIAMAFRIIQANTIAFIHNTSVLLALGMRLYKFGCRKVQLRSSSTTIIYSARAAAAAAGGF